MTKTKPATHAHMFVSPIGDGPSVSNALGRELRACENRTNRLNGVKACLVEQRASAQRSLSLATRLMRLLSAEIVTLDRQIAALERD